MNYEKMIPPFKMVDFCEMTKKQAQVFFDWYISQIDYRISILLETVKKDGIKYDFDFSVESLIPLWEWYEEKISLRNLSDKEYETRIEQYPEWMKNYISKTTLSSETLMYCLDIALYFAQVVVINNKPKVKWGFFTKPKNRYGVNEPTLLGFNYDIDLNPRLIVFNCTQRSVKEKNPTTLYDTYNVWMTYL